MKKYDKLKLGFITAIRDEYAIPTNENNDALIKFRQWLVDEGEEYIIQILNGDENLSEENLILAQACIVWRGDRLKKLQTQGFLAKSADEQKMIDFVDDLWSEGKKILQKGYAGEKISDDDCEILNLYRILAETHILGVPVWEYELNKDSQNDNPFRFVGNEIKYPELPELSDVLKSSSYTDKQPAPSLKLLSKEAHKDFIPLLDAFQNHKKNCSKKISNDKPTCLIIASSADCFLPRCTPDIEFLKRAYGDKMNFKFINVRLWDFMIQIDNPYANQPEKELYCPFETLEERARTTKALYLTQPWFSLDCELDFPSDICANLFQCPGGEAQVLILDKDNKLIWKSNKGWGYWFNNRPSAPWLTDNVFWADEVEQEIISALSTGKNKNNIKHFVADIAEEDEIKENSFKAYLLPSKVISIDLDKEEIILKGRPAARFSVILKKPDDYDECNPLIDIKVKFKTGKLLYRNKPITLEKLQIGDIINGWVEKEKNREWYCSGLNISRKAEPKGESNEKTAIIHCYGNFISYDCETHKLKIKIIQNNTLGENLINENKDAYDLPYETKIYLTHFASDDKEIELLINEDSLLRKNGKECDIKSFNKGDFIHTEFIYKENHEERKPRLLRGYSRIIKVPFM